MRTVVAKISNEGLRFSRQSLVSWASTNLPPSAFSFSNREEIYWELTMQSFEKNCLNVAVTDYEADPAAYQPERQARASVHRVHFAPLDPLLFFGQLTHYKKADLVEVLLPKEEVPEPPNFAPAASPNFSDITPTWEARPETRRVNFTLPLLELTFRNGYVSGNHQPLGVEEKLPFVIHNDQLVAEFESIKAYFAARLKRKTISVAATLTNDTPTGAYELRKATSPQIAAIDESMIEILRVKTLRDLTGGGLVRSIDKALFTPEDVFGSLDDDELGKALLPNDSRDLLAAILANLEVRNARELDFLAGRLHGVDQKLRFVLSPNFGFVFLARGREANHFVLELLNDHATYIWSIPNTWGDDAEQYLAVERELATIAAAGRQQYKRLLSFEHYFWYVVHESSETGVVDGFPRWRNRLLEGLV